MAKKSSQAVSQSTIQAAETKIEEFAEDLSRLLGNAQSKAEGWLGQRKAIGEHLTDIRNTAAALLGQLGIAAAQPKRGRPRARTAAATAATPAAATATKAGGRKRRTMSPEARARIGEAQRKRWAKLKREAK